MARHRHPKPVAPKRGLKVASYRSRPTLANVKGTTLQRQAAWRSFRSVKFAVRMLIELGMHVDSRSIEGATRLIARHVPAVEPVSAKTVLENGMCRCLLDRWTTAQRRIVSKAKPKRFIPPFWRKLSRKDLMDLAAGFRDERDVEREGRLEAIRKQREMVQARDPLAGDVARLTALAASLAPVTIPGVGMTLLTDGEVDGC